MKRIHAIVIETFAISDDFALICSPIVFFPASKIAQRIRNERKADGGL